MAETANKLIRLLPFANAVGNGMNTIDILGNTKGNTIERIHLCLGGTALTKAMMTGIQIKANNGKLLFDDSGARVDARMKYRTIADDAAFLTLDFAEIRSKTAMGQSLGSIDTTFGIQDLKGEITIAGATAPTLTAWAEISAPQELPEQQQTRGLIAKVLKTEQAIVGAANKIALSVPGFGSIRSLVKRVHIFHTGHCTAVEVKKGGITRFEADKATNEFIQKGFLKTPQANVFTVDFIKDGNQSNMFNTYGDNIEFYGTFDAADTLTLVAELMAPLESF